MTEQHRPPEVPAVLTVTTTNRAGTISVRATDQGLPVDIRIDKSELRFGATPLADELLRLVKQSALEAGARRRDLLAQSGVSRDVLDRLGLPTRDQVADQQHTADHEDTAPTSWMRPV